MKKLTLTFCFHCCLFLIGNNKLNAQKTITIGTQIWMAEDLEVTNFKNGDPINNDHESWEQFGINGNPAMIPPHYYNWFVVGDKRGVCPQGFRIPNNADWNKLINHLGGREIAGRKLKNTDELWSNDEGSTGLGDNSSGFGADPDTYYDANGFYGDAERNKYYWSRNEENGFAYAFRISGLDDEVDLNLNSKESGYCIRCIKQ